MKFASRVLEGSVAMSFFMNKFRELGLIDHNDSIEVHSSLLNVVVHDQPQIRS
jgi:CRP/FNR family transcriptional regulator, cyclic AMP receptor protein